MVVEDQTELGRTLIGQARYQRAANLGQAPEVVDCSGFVKWLYAGRGIWLPRRTVQQVRVGEPVDVSELRAGDLVFMTGTMPWPGEGVGHVGVVTPDETVLHAEGNARRNGVYEDSLRDFLKSSRFVSARRIVPETATLVTLTIPEGINVESGEDVRLLLVAELTWPQHDSSRAQTPTESADP